MVKASTSSRAGERAAAGAETRDPAELRALGRYAQPHAHTPRRRCRPPEQPSSQRGGGGRIGGRSRIGPQPDREPQPDRATAAGSSVFAPGYGGNRRGTDRAPGSESGGPDSSHWYGSTAGGAAGKGPVRGYPPVPGQPPPMYPPGPFAAWNRGRHGQAGPVAPPGQPDGAQPDRGQPGSGQPGSGRAEASGAPPAASRAATAASRPPGSRRRRPGRRPARRAITTGLTAPRPSPAIRSWPSATRPQM